MFGVFGFRDTLKGLGTKLVHKFDLRPGAIVVGCFAPFFFLIPVCSIGRPVAVAKQTETRWSRGITGDFIGPLKPKIANKLIEIQQTTK